MNAPRPDRPHVQVRVEVLGVTSDSPVEARRLARALPAALERALSGWPDRPDQRRPDAYADLTTRRADGVAADVADAIHRRLGTPGGAT
ncbi:hypothetical protein HP550_20370 [Cellulomonas humilata]|uniref:Uncharacterized protein n=1 Tax=Cellulomonas humilata TaxID=144055 RepID=A0A7Y6A4I4_9CELL|nr:hypothetical protein [Cellulomonas humilata]NUU19606.1 hypothetical protein [Cellulomonas humilata]